MTPIDLAALPDTLIIPGLARWLGVDTDTPPDVDTGTLAEIARLTGQADALQQQVTAAREHGQALVTARDFADSDSAGYIDRTGLEGP